VRTVGGERKRSQGTHQGTGLFQHLLCASAFESACSRVVWVTAATEYSTDPIGGRLRPFGLSPSGLTFSVASLSKGVTSRAPAVGDFAGTDHDGHDDRESGEMPK
jgi:hypothetical protein